MNDKNARRAPTSDTTVITVLGDANALDAFASETEQPAEAGARGHDSARTKGVPPLVNGAAAGHRARGVWIAAAAAAAAWVFAGVELTPFLMRDTPALVSSDSSLGQGPTRQRSPVMELPSGLSNPAFTEVTLPAPPINLPLRSGERPSARSNTTPARVITPAARNETRPAAVPRIPFQERWSNWTPSPSAPGTVPEGGASQTTAPPGVSAAIDAVPPVVSPPASTAVADVTAGVPPRTPAAEPPSNSERAAARATSPIAGDKNEVNRLLERYRTAYSHLNVYDAKAVWPSVDVATLSKAFEQLQSQDIEFTKCQVTVIGDEARAVCDGNAAFVPKVGSRTTRSASRQWTFALNRLGGDWVITRVNIR